MSKKYNFDFVAKFPIAVIISTLLIVGSLGLLIKKGLNYGVDFRGGAEVQVKFTEPVSVSDLRASLNGGKLKISSIQSIGDASNNELLIKVGADEKNMNEVTNAITTIVMKDFASKGSEIRKTDIVGAKAGERLRISGFQAMVWALLAIMIYIGLRFDFKYAPGAIVALLHDVIIILGIFSLMDKEFSLQIVGALLAVIGYSVNDTVVVYDRVREHEEKSPSKMQKLINIALNETLSRTILTSATTLFVSVMMFSMGGGVIHDFFFAITLGVIIGTYSSLFVAAPTVLFLDLFQSKEA
jgi:preprotein translocase subunit SecF